MERQQRSNSMVYVLIGSALLLAFVTFLTILLLASRPSSEEGDPNASNPAPQPPSLVINGVQIFLNTDPNKEILLDSELATPQPQPIDPNVPATETPTPPPEGPTATPVAPPPPTPDPTTVIFIDYTVLQGDTLYSIAEAQNSSIELMALNQIDAGNLVPGAVITRLPVANPAHCPGQRAYVVRDKDTVFRIAAVFGTTPEAIAAANGLDTNYMVKVTEVICIPV